MVEPLPAAKTVCAVCGGEGFTFQQREDKGVAVACACTEQCSVCHGLPGEPKGAIQQGMYPVPPQLFHGTGVTDDDAWESYWKVENGIRMTGMPGFKGQLTETQIWQVTVLVKNADKISDAVKKELAAGASSPMSMAMPDSTPAPKKK